jgi:hypothetical protein
MSVLVSLLISESLIFVGRPVGRQGRSVLCSASGYPSVISLCIFLKGFISHRVYTECTRINYKIIPVTNLNKYLQYGRSGTEQYAHKYRSK